MNLASLDLNLLVVLDALLEEGHVTRAARRLGLSQPAVSHALGRLRALLGDELFVRSRGGVTPTARARALREPLRRALAELEGALAERPTFDPAAAQRTFTLGSTDYAAFVLLPPLMARLAREAPGVNVVVRSGEELTPALDEGHVDLLLSPLTSLEAREAHRHKELFVERFVCVVREGHPLARRKLTLRRWVELPHALVAPRGRAGSIVDTVLASHGLRRRTSLAMPHFLVAPHVIASTDLIVTLAERVAKRFAEWLPLRIKAPPVEIPTFTIASVWHRRSEGDPAMAWLRSVLEEVAAEA